MLLHDLHTMYAAYLNLANRLEEQGHPNAAAVRAMSDFVLEGIDMAMLGVDPNTDAINFLDRIRNVS